MFRGVTPENLIVFGITVMVAVSLQWTITRAMQKSYKFSQICPFPMLQQQSREEEERNWSIEKREAVSVEVWRLKARSLVVKSGRQWQKRG